MPKQKDFKRIVRSRMQKTGEAYTTARSRILDKKTPLADEAPKDCAALAGMSDEAVKAKTGCAWNKWVFVLDRAGAREWPHREIARYVHETYGLSGWWAQTVTVGYERIHGLREIGQRRSGSYEANKSRTFSVPIGRLYAAFSRVSIRRKWLGDVDLTVRKATPNRSLRITWDDSTSVEIWFTTKSDSKSQVQIQHTRLGSKSDAEARKKFWNEKLDRLKAVLIRP